MQLRLFKQEQDKRKGVRITIDTGFGFSKGCKVTILYLFTFDLTVVKLSRRDIQLQTSEI